MKASAERGARDAMARFKVAAGFLGGQMAAAGDLFRNLRGGLGGSYHPALAGQGWTPPEGFSHELGRAMHRDQALGNMKTLLPSMAAGGAAYLLHGHMQRKKQEEQARQQALMAQQDYGQGGMM